MKNLFLLLALLSTMVLNNCKRSNTTMTNEDVTIFETSSTKEEVIQKHAGAIDAESPQESNRPQGGPEGSYNAEASHVMDSQRGPASISSHEAPSRVQGIPSTAQSSSSSQLHLRIKRIYKEEKCIIGKIYRVENSVLEQVEKYLSYTLELPYTFNLKNISSIPIGTYYGDIRTDGARGWRIQLENVQGDRTLIQIHVGNYPKNTTGCILLGTKVLEDDALKCTLLNSKKAMNSLESDFITYNTLLGLQKSCPELRVKLEVM